MQSGSARSIQGIAAALAIALLIMLTTPAQSYGVHAAGGGGSAPRTSKPTAAQQEAMAGTAFKPLTLHQEKLLMKSDSYFAPIRFAVISDSHIKYDVGYGTAEQAGYSELPFDRLSNLGPYLSEWNPTIPQGIHGGLDFIAHTGDNIGDLYGGFTLGVPEPGINGVIGNYNRALSTFDPTPYYIALGNHDNRQYHWAPWPADGDNGRFKYFRHEAADLWHSLAKSGEYHFKLPVVNTETNRSSSAISRAHTSQTITAKEWPNTTYNQHYYSWEQGGWLFFVLDSTAEAPEGKDIYDGESKDEKHRYNDGAHFGFTQIEWLKDSMKVPQASSNDVPVVLFFHSIEGLDTATDINSKMFRQLIRDNENRIQAIFVGHTHKFNDTATFPGTSIPVYTAGSTTAKTRYWMNADGTVCKNKDGGKAVAGYDWPDYNPYYLVEADANTERVSIINADDHIFLFDKHGVEKPGHKAPIIATIPGDNGAPTK